MVNSAGLAVIVERQISCNLMELLYPRRIFMPFATDRLLAAVEAIYDAAPNASLWPDALGKVATCFDDVGAILQWRKDDARFGTIVSESLTAATHEYTAVGEHDFKRDRAVQAGFYFHGEPITDRHVGPVDDAYLNHPFQKEFLEKYGLGWFAGVTVSPDPRIGVVLSVQRDCATFLN